MCTTRQRPRCVSPPKHWLVLQLPQHYHLKLLVYRIPTIIIPFILPITVHHSQVISSTAPYKLPKLGASRWLRQTTSHHALTTVTCTNSSFRISSSCMLVFFFPTHTTASRRRTYCNMLHPSPLHAPPQRQTLSKGPCHHRQLPKESTSNTSYIVVSLESEANTTTLHSSRSSSTSDHLPALPSPAMSPPLAKSRVSFLNWHPTLTFCEPGFCSASFS